jgi:hypothetical protein
VRERRAMTNPSWRLLTALCALAATCGCSELDNCPDAQEAIIIDRPEATHLDELVFESSAAWQDFDAFPAKTELKFKHDLGVKPYFVTSYLSFTATATNGKGGGSFTEAAGNEVAFQCIDSHTIVIKNDTCEESFFVKVVALALPDGDPNDDTCD